MHGAKTTLDMRTVNATTRAQHHVIATGLIAPHFGIAHVARQVLGIVLRSQHNALLAKRLPIGALDIHGIGATAGVDIVINAVRIGELNVAGIEHANATVLDQCRARVHAMAVERLVGKQRRANIFPFHKVAARGMAPHLDAAVYIKRGILEVCVKHAIGLAKPVGVVESAHGRHNMKMLSIGPVTALGGRCIHVGNELGKIALKCVRHVGIQSN